MSAINLPPSIPGEFEALKERVTRLEKKRIPEPQPFEPDLVFSWYGAVAVFVSGPAVVRKARRIVETVAALSVTGSTDTVIEIRRNGFNRLEVTIPAGRVRVNVPCSIRVSADQDVMSVATTTAGTGAENLTVFLRFKG